MSILYILQNLFLNIIILFFLYKDIDCQLIIPIKYFPIYKYNYSNPSQIMQTIVSTKVYGSLEIGTPKKEIELPIDFNSNDFYISDNPIDFFEEKENLFSDIKFYSSLNSSSRIPLEDIYLDGNNFDLGEYSLESFFFNDKKYELGFYLPIQLNYPESGGIGLLLQSSSAATPNEDKTFFKILKDKNLIKSYYWSIFYNSKEITKEEEGFLLLGSLPHELENNLGYYNHSYFNNSELKNIDNKISRELLLNQFEIDDIIAFKGNDSNKTIDDFFINKTNNKDFKNIQLNYHSRGIQAPYFLLDKYETIFEPYILRGECFKDSFYYIERKIFFYCKNNKQTINEIKKFFPGFNFISKGLENNFYLISDDLFLEKEDYIFCLLYFHNNIYSENKWIMGKPFLKNYQFIFNPDNKQIYFYLNKENDESNKNTEKESNLPKEKISITLMIVIISIAIVIISVICFILFKCYLIEKYNRKKRANELDDDYDYIQKSDKENQSSNNNDNLIINKEE